MFALGIVLLIAAALLVIWVFYGLNGQSNDIKFDAPGIHTNISPLTLFLLGALALLLVWAATRLFAAAARHARHRRQERKSLERENKAALKGRKDAIAERDAAVHERDDLRTDRDQEVENRETAEARARVWERDARDEHVQVDHVDVEPGARHIRPRD